MGSRAPSSFQAGEEWNSCHTHTGILWPKKTTVLQTDASIIGLGTCLLQDEKPVYFASKALTEAQQGYVTIELESLAVAWVMEKFHHFLYGNHFLLETDQKPLETILSRSLNQATPRLQRILIRTFPYNFSVHYLPGLKNQLADCLSWVGGLQDTISLPKLSINQITSQLNARSDSLQQLWEASQADDTLAILKYTIQKGWLSNIKELSSEIQAFWTFWEELIIEDGPKPEARRNTKTDSWRSPGTNQVQAEGKGNCILVWPKWPIGEIGVKLPTVPKILTIKMQANT